MSWRVVRGDCVEQMQAMEPCSVDAVVCDPPYNLSDSGKRDAECLRSVLLKVGLPHNEERHPEVREGDDLAAPGAGGAPLSGVDGAVRVDAQIRMPEGAVDFKRTTVGQQEVDHGDEPSAASADGNLPSITDAECGQVLGHYVLKVADGGDAAFCDTTCSCFTEPSAGVLALDVVVAGAAGRYLAGDDFGRARTGDTDVRSGDDALGQAEGPAGVVAFAGAVVRAVLRLDLRGGAHELRGADGAAQHDPLFLVAPSEDVGAVARAGRLTADAQSRRVRLVGAVADGALALDAPWHALKPSRQTGGFMGRTWDGWESPAAFQRWCAAWAREALRVLKPGGHLLAMGGTRTYHRLTCGLEDAGFEIRDCLSYLYGSGFPKSLDVSKAIDKQAPRVGMFDTFAAHFAECRASKGLSQKEIAAHFPSKTGGLTGCVWNWENGANVPTPEQWTVLQPLLDLSDEWLLLIERVEAEREKVGERTTGIGTGRGATPIMGDSENRDLTAPATPEAERWQGFGTALKPSHEPIVVARKPLSGTVAQTVLEHGTGALNVAASRIGYQGEADRTKSARTGDYDAYDGGDTATEALGSTLLHGEQHASGRWPANVVLDEEAAWLLDEQTGELTTPGATTSRGPHSHVFERDDLAGPVQLYGDSGGASRFFYVAKASRGERNAGLEGFEEQQSRRHGDRAPGELTHPSGALKQSGQGAVRSQNVHPTVKPVELMRWLVRLVTPPGGTCVDPFAGSGTTGVACVLEGFDFIGIEREAEYADIAEARIGWWEKHKGDGQAAAVLAAGEVRDAVEATGQLELGDGEAA